MTTPTRIIEYINELQDPCLTLEAWKKIIDVLIEKHGSSTEMFTDAGYNNVSFLVSKKP